MAKRTEILNLSFLQEHEREMILSVLQKDDKLRKREEKRIRKLKNELLELKRRGRRGNPEQRECGVCLRALGLILQRGSVCFECHRRVCSYCTAIRSNSSNTKCTVCAKSAELKVVTGEWFLEERAKRFEHTTVPSSDVIKQSILKSVPDGQSGQNKLSSSGLDRPATPHSERSASPQSEKSVGRYIGKKKGTKPVAVESSGLPTTPNNLRSHPGRAPSQAEGRKRPDGAESVCSAHRSDSIPENISIEGKRKDSGTPSIAVSRASLSSDRSRSEVDLSNLSDGFSNDLLPGRCRSVPGLNDGDSDEDIDALMSAHYKTTRSVSSAQSVSSLNSIMSVYSEMGDYGNARVSGEILLNISYSYKTGALNILVRECRCLATGDDRRQRTDPYVKTYLLPDKSRQSKRKTSIKSNTTDPVFNENLRYVVSHSQLETRTLQVSVWHHDRFGHNTFLGETELTFDSWEFDKQIEDWFPLQPRAECSTDSLMQYKGELTVVLKYIPAERNLSLPLDQIQVKRGFLKGKKSITLPKGGMVELLVKEAKNLTAVKSGSSDSFVKGYLLPDDKKSTKHKTAVVKRSVNPRWNHTFTYCGLQHSDLDSVCLELTVWDKEPLASNVFLGGVRLGAGTGLSYGKEVDWNDSYGEEQRLWQRMIDNPEVPQECTLMLRSSMAKRKT
ncbi:synaptotagmin-like protein 5 [Neoarius graeffei]|uniref:synaptotagmin-like protein 5 n=1 Tax=Neoarius graeffei TaxID=443677 RepID=UPI00298CB5C2|nr:synaptotagmin-like protein 5 [Neoarius graeffei]XP_060785372.1 synaptotagmin-like protein 5 [Neoarius graeffei]XP_060785373.1 synaptotagmin-like protein 5 [Neoarius graeffei]XP_060785374.1 synaptotagmin-like protein 5 [Neoarius graeffei]XP_060785375.1 synaptotagmin-like protein 5 [Neoarius graeffei]